MDFKTQNNSQQAAQGAPATHHAPQSNNSHNRRSWMKLVGLLVAFAVVAALVVGGYLMVKAKQSSGPDADRFQAVFMTNGQVYFGKMTKPTGNYTELTQVYYLQVQQSVQPSTENKAPAATDDSQVSLTKLGNELHGPTDKMHISNDQVLFWEDLKDDSTVVKAINSYENK